MDRHHKHNACAFSVEPMEQRLFLSASRVTELPRPPESRTIYAVGSIGDTAIYAQDDGLHGVELFATGIAKHSTVLLKDLNAGKPSSNPGFVGQIGNTLFFSAVVNGGTSLWKTDGTAQGTLKVADVVPDGPHATLGSDLFFVGHQNNGTDKLWKTDGTPAGTKNLISDSATFVSPNGTLAANNTYLYFAASNPTTGNELWRSDGTVAGTVLVKDQVKGSESLNPYNFVRVGNSVYFLDNIDTFGRTKQHLWRIGTTVDLVETATFSSKEAPITQLTAARDSLYFVEDEGQTIPGPDSVWRVTAASNSLHRVGRFENPVILPRDANRADGSEIYVHEAGGDIGSKHPIYAVTGDTAAKIVADAGAAKNLHAKQINDKLYFAKPFASGTGQEVGVSDGTISGTAVLKTFPNTPVVQDFTSTQFYVLFVTSDKAFYQDSNNTPLYRTSVLWVVNSSNGVSKDVTLRTGETLTLGPTNTIVANRYLYFMPEEFSTGRELWRATGFPNQTHLTHDLLRTTLPANPGKILSGINGVYFDAGSSLWNRRADGTITRLGDAIFADFSATINGRTILGGTTNTIVVTDGTPAGTKTIFRAAQGYFSNFTAARNVVYFEYGDNLWKTDGTVSGTVEVKANVNTLFGTFASKDTLLFFGFDPRPNKTGSQGLWRSDGTASGTFRLLELYPNQFVSFKGQIYFVGTTKDAVSGLYKTDGTAAGTKLIRTGPVGDMVIAGDLIYTVSNSSLWISDGTTTGTRMIKQIPSYGGFVKAVGDRIYFSAGYEATGSELWTSTGTKKTTVLLKDINSGSEDSLRFYSQSSGEGSDSIKDPTEGIAVGNKLYFAADDGVHGIELWETDATPTGTKLVQDITPNGDSRPSNFFLQGNTLLFSVGDVVRGWDLWKLPLG